MVCRRKSVRSDKSGTLILQSADFSVKKNALPKVATQPFRTPTSKNPSCGKHPKPQNPADSQLIAADFPGRDIGHAKFSSQNFFFYKNYYFYKYGHREKDGL